MARKWQNHHGIRTCVTFRLASARLLFFRTTYGASDTFNAARISVITTGVYGGVTKAVPGAENMTTLVTLTGK